MFQLLLDIPSRLSQELLNIAAKDYYSEKLELTSFASSRSLGIIRAAILGSVSRVIHVIVLVTAGLGSLRQVVVLRRAFLDGLVLLWSNW